MEAYIKKGRELSESLEKRREEMKSKKFDTIAVHGIYDTYDTLKNQGSVIEPIFLSSAEAFENSSHMEAALAYEMPAWGYSRIANPSVAYLEETLALLEGYQTNEKLHAMVTSSGMAAVFMATNPLLAESKKIPGNKKNIVVSAKCYGGTFMLFNERYSKERSIEIRWVEDPMDTNEWESKIDENTRFLYGEMPSNPQLSAFDIEDVAKLAHKNEIPLIVDSTLATPALMRPIQFGADIVVHSVSKSMSKSGFSIAGAIISKANIPCKFFEEELTKNYAGYLKLHPARDFGCSLSPFNAIMALNDLRTLRSTILQMSNSAMQVASFLNAHPKIESVNYPGLSETETNGLAKKYMRLVDSGESSGEDMNLFGHLMSFTLKDGPAAARSLLDKLETILIATDLGRVKTIANIPAISTHQQQGEEGRKIAQIPENMIRLSIGLENPIDIIEDLNNAI